MDNVIVALEVSKHAVKMKEMGSKKASETAARFALRLAPEDPRVLTNVGCVLLTTRHAAEARQLTAKAIRLDPTLALPLAENLGIASAYAGELGQAIRYLQEVDRPTVEARFDLANFTLLSGDWREGAKLMEVRRERAGGSIDVGVPEWDGSPTKCLWVHLEQGQGDMIQFARFLPWARTRCERLIVSAPYTLMALLYGYPGVDEVRISDEMVPSPADATAHTLSMSLMRLYGTTQDNVPADPGHFRRCAAAVELEVSKVQRALITVGLCWAGSPAHARDSERSVPFITASPLLEEPRAQFMALQAGPRGDDPQTIALHPLIEDLRPAMGNWTRTAAILLAMDLVVTVDTAIAHLAGALGVPTWLMLPKVPDWRWGAASTKTPWYPSMRLFRQKRMGDWDQVVADVAQALERDLDEREKLLAGHAQAAQALRRTPANDAVAQAMGAVAR